ncbi:hypothetical protein H0X06_04765 [Candidatus Dependentiae bacterium]|nr:hypothetical protein [Candidatus Dependentiae bacterium]
MNISYMTLPLVLMKSGLFGSSYPSGEHAPKPGPLSEQDIIRRDQPARTEDERTVSTTRNVPNVPQSTRKTSMQTQKSWLEKLQQFIQPPRPTQATTEREYRFDPRAAASEPISQNVSSVLKQSLSGKVSEWAEKFKSTYLHTNTPGYEQRPRPDDIRGGPYPSPLSSGDNPFPNAQFREREFRDTPPQQVEEKSWSQIVRNLKDQAATAIIEKKPQREDLSQV